jgi:hypothetical protein
MTFLFRRIFLDPNLLRLRNFGIKFFIKIKLGANMLTHILLSRMRGKYVGFSLLSWTVLYVMCTTIIIVFYYQLDAQIIYSLF